MYAILMQCSLKKLVFRLAWQPPQNELKVLVSWTFRLVHCANGMLLDLLRMNFMLWGEWFVGECRCVWRRLHTVYHVCCWKLSDNGNVQSSWRSNVNHMIRRPLYRVAQKSKLLYCVNSLLLFEPPCRLRAHYNLLCTDSCSVIRLWR